jgi:hypothetical protein
VRQPLVQVHVRPVEERISLCQHDNIPARVQMCREPDSTRFVEIIESALIAARMRCRLGRDRVHQRLFDLPVPHVPRGNGSGDTAAVPGHVEGDHTG